MGQKSSKKSPPAEAPIVASVADAPPADAPPVAHHEHPPRVGEAVSTPYGHGHVSAYREDGLVEVELLWTMAQGQRVMAYMNEDSVHAEAELPEPEEPESLLDSVAAAVLDEAPARSRKATTTELAANVMQAGTPVDTPYGAGRVVRYRRADGFYEVTLGWRLADGRPATSFMQPDQLRRQCVAAEGDFVSTVYGTGIVRGFRAADGAHEVLLRQLQGSATAFMQADVIRTPAIAAAVGCKVATQYGKGMVIGYSADTDVYRVDLPFGLAYLQRDTIVEVLDDDEDVGVLAECVVS